MNKMIYSKVMKACGTPSCLCLPDVGIKCEGPEVIGKGKNTRRETVPNLSSTTHERPREPMPEYSVTSEIYTEYEYGTRRTPAIEGNVISEFPFHLPKTLCLPSYDEDDDLDLERPSKEIIIIEHRPSTALKLVGLQVWRGAFLLADLVIHLGLQNELKDKVLLELGAGTGFTSFVAALYAKTVICTDIDLGGILDLIKLNAQYNSKHIQSGFLVKTIDFTDTRWDQELISEIEKVDIILAADVVYDDDITAAFVSTIQKILNMKPPKTLYMALEKRYVFTIENLESVAPCYETFLSLLDKVKGDWSVEKMEVNFPKYFHYERVKELVLWKISSK